MSDTRTPSVTPGLEKKPSADIVFEYHRETCLSRRSDRCWGKKRWFKIKMYSLMLRPQMTCCTVENRCQQFTAEKLWVILRFWLHYTHISLVFLIVNDTFFVIHVCMKRFRLGPEKRERTFITLFSLFLNVYSCWSQCCFPCLNQCEVVISRSFVVQNYYNNGDARAAFICRSMDVHTHYYRIFCHAKTLFHWNNHLRNLHNHLINKQIVRKERCDDNLVHVHSHKLQRSKDVTK